MFYFIMWQGAYKKPSHSLKLLSVLVLLVVSVFKSSGQRTECKVVTQCSTMSYHNGSMTTQKENKYTYGGFVRLKTEKKLFSYENLY